MPPQAKEKFGKALRDSPENRNHSHRRSTGAIALLGLLEMSPQQAFPLSEIARRLSLPKSYGTEHMQRHSVGGQLLRRTQNGYQLGRRLVQLGSAYVTSIDIVQDIAKCVPTDRFRSECHDPACRSRRGDQCGLSRTPGLLERASAWIKGRNWPSRARQLHSRRQGSSCCSSSRPAGKTSRNRACAAGPHQEVDFYLLAEAGKELALIQARLPRAARMKRYCSRCRLHCACGNVTSHREDGLLTPSTSAHGDEGDVTPKRQKLMHDTLSRFSR